MIIANCLLKVYTRHGQEYIIPNIVGKKVDDIVQADSLKHFEVYIIDSVFKDDLPNGTILSQDPVFGTRSKDGRKIYITVATSNGKIISMPNCVDKSIKTAVQLLCDNDLKVGTILYRQGEFDGLVVSQLFGGKPISAATSIQSNESIDLLVEVTSTTASVRIPDILGKTQAEAQRLLWRSGLNVGKCTFKGAQDRNHTRVAGYTPTTSRVIIGTAINLDFINDTESSYRSTINAFRNEQQQEEIQSVIDTLVLSEDQDPQTQMPEVIEKDHNTTK